jgi:DNA mismatch repair protein MSH6
VCDILILVWCSFNRSCSPCLFLDLLNVQILLEGGENGASPTLQSLIRSVQTSSQQAFRVETIRSEESFPKSTALDVSVQRKLERRGNKVHPWQVEETLNELHRRKYYPRASKRDEDRGVSRWPQVLRAAVEGEANLALSSFGATLYYLQRNLIAGEILSMGIVKAYVPPESSVAARQAAGGMTQLAAEQNRLESGVDGHTGNTQGDGQAAMEFSQHESLNTESEISHMSLDGTTLHNLEILTNAVDHKVAGSLWSKINYTKTPHGARLLRAWLLRPLFRKVEIDRRSDAVEELVSGGAAVALSEATSVLAKCGDIERLLSRVHSMSGNTLPGADEDESSRIHPSDRAVLYENATYNKRKVSDFSRVLQGLRHAAQIPELFAGIEIQSGLLCKIVRHADQGGCFPSMEQELDWFFENFDCDEAAKGLFEPSKGVDDIYDDANETIERIQSELNDYKNEMCSNVLQPRSLAKSSWKYINTNPEQKDKYLIELPASVAVPDDFILKGKRGSGQKQVNKYRTADVEEFVQQLEAAIDVKKERKAVGMRLIFSKFDSMRTIWAAVAQTTAILDAVGSLAQTASRAGYVRPRILECPPEGAPSIRVIQGRHPSVENTISSTEFVPNDLSLGAEASDGSLSRVLLLSGPNMGGMYRMYTTVLSLEPCCHTYFSHVLDIHIFLHYSCNCRQEYAASSDVFDYHHGPNRILCSC